VVVIRILLAAVALFWSEATAVAKEKRRAAALICTEEQEQNCIAKMQGIASRLGSVLTLKLANGEIRSYESNSEACQDGPKQCFIYSLAAYVASSGYVGIRIRLYEGDGGEVINVKTGNSVPLSSAPAFSPDGKRFAVMPDNAHFSFGYLFSIWRFNSNGPVLEFTAKRSPDGSEFWSFDRWSGSQKVSFTVGFPDERFSTASALLTKGGWRLYGAKRHSPPRRRAVRS
jgi:hypothetical protein